jgi:hypothetical protein
VVSDFSVISLAAGSDATPPRHGQSRSAGHGSPRGVRQGGRRQGTPNKRTLERQAEMDELLAAGDSPLA